MNYLTLENVTKTYGDKVLFENVTLHINHGDKVALVAKNGTGKTTLLRLIAGQESGEGEKYSILLHKGIRVGYLQQDPQLLDALMAFQDQVEESTAQAAVLPRFLALPLCLWPTQKARHQIQQRLAKLLVQSSNSTTTTTGHKENKLV